jgi:hypothetical protein
VALETEHPELVTPESPTQRVVARFSTAFAAHDHLERMLSLDNALNEGELRDFDRRVRELLGGAKYGYVAELKMDGLSMAAHYRAGVFTQALTRGDGVIDAALLLADQPDVVVQLRASVIHREQRAVVRVLDAPGPARDVRRRRGEAVRGLVLVNPSLAPDTRLFLLAPVLKHVLRSLPGIASDIADSETPPGTGTRFVNPGEILTA